MFEVSCTSRTNLIKAVSVSKGWPPGFWIGSNVVIPFGSTISVMPGAAGDCAKMLEVKASTASNVAIPFKPFCMRDRFWFGIFNAKEKIELVFDYFF